MNYISSKKICILIVFVLVFILSGCQGLKKDTGNPEELVKETITKMKALGSYESTVLVKIAPEEPEADGGHMKADIVFHKKPFSYSNSQELSMTSGDSNQTLDKIELKNYVVDNTAYMYQSITDIWVNDDNKDLIQQVEELANIFDSFEPQHFTDLRVKEETKDKIVVAGMTNSSAFLFNLMQNFEESVTGSFEMVINKETKYLESLLYTPNIETEDGHVNHEITIESKSFNKAPQIQVPDEAKQ